MKRKFNIAVAQVNPIVGDVEYNFRKIVDFALKNEAKEADIIVFPEMCLAGYPPEDLIYRNSFLKKCDDYIKKLAIFSEEHGKAIILGAPLLRDGKRYNSAIVVDNGKITEVYKTELPNYGVFDEVRVFSSSPNVSPVKINGINVGLMICEDMWYPSVAKKLCDKGAEILISINGSPYEMGKEKTREEIAQKRCQETKLPLIYSNLFGGQDELVFDGCSFVLSSKGVLEARLSDWQEDIQNTVWEAEGGKALSFVSGIINKRVEKNEAIYQAMVCSLRDYINKNSFKGVVLGMSGGIDSALSAAVAVDALGAERVKLFMLPSPYTSKESIEDATKAAELLKTEIGTISIEPAMKAFDKMLSPLFKGTEKDITEENIQARTRGLALMAYSNKFGYMVLSTGNKSENSVGYATLYGDMCGGYNVLKDLYKMSVFEVSRWRNENMPKNCLGYGDAVMPERIITKPPSAELRPDQKDEDSLPPYEILDAILKCLIEKEMGVKEIIEEGFDEETVKRVWTLLKRAEYKRRQSPLGVKITACSFGKERRYPITNKYEG